MSGWRWPRQAGLGFVALAVAVGVVAPSPGVAGAAGVPTIDTVVGGVLDGGPAATTPQEPGSVAVFGTTVYTADVTSRVIWALDTTTGAVTRYAGTGLDPGASSDGALATATSMYPVGLVVDADGNVFYSDPAKVRRIDAVTKAVTTVAGTGTAGYTGDGIGATVSKLSSPTGLAIAANGDVYIADTANNRVRRVDAATGTISTVAGTGTSGSTGDGGPATSATLAQPKGVALDATGGLYIAEYAGHRIRKVSSGTIARVAGDGVSGFIGDGGPALNARLASPSQLSVTPAGSLLIADFRNNRIRAIDLTSGLISTVAGSAATTLGDGGPASSARLVLPAHAVTDAGGTTWIADTGGLRLRKVVGGTISTAAGLGTMVSPDGTPGPEVALLGLADMATDARGDLYYTDTRTDRVLRLSTADGTVSVFAGSMDGATTTTGDGGPAVDARLVNPRGLAIDLAGNVWIGTDGSTIRRVDALTGDIELVDTKAPNGNPTSVDAPHLAFEPAGSLLVGSSKVLYRVDPRTKVVTQVAKVIADADALAIRAVAVAPDGTIYVAASGFGNRLSRVDPSTGAVSTIAALDGTAIGGLAFAADGDLLVSAPDATVRSYDTSDWTYAVLAGTPGSSGFSGDGGPATSAQLASPSQLAVGPDGTAYVVANSRIRAVSDPAAPNVPGAPAVTAAPRPLAGAALVSWSTPTTNGGSPITGYVVTPYIGSTAGTPTTFASHTPSGVVTGLVNGTTYTFTVAALNANGIGSASAKSQPTTPQWWKPWSNGTAALDSLFSQLRGSGPTSAERSSWTSQLASGAKRQADLVVALRGQSDAVNNVDPTARLYAAYLVRIPDASGLNYWLTRRRQGWTLYRMSSVFASSSEFKRRYGTLNSEQFVKQVYLNVLGRPGDAGGIAFWTGRLDRGLIGRGQVMISFSESSEYQTSQAANTHAAALFIALLGRAPTVAERNAFTSALDGGTPLADLVTDLLRSDELAARVS